MNPAAALLQFVDAHAPVLVLTGAGLSTGSGIPAYRNARGEWTRPAPVTHQNFLRSALVRRRYWARSMHGWPAFAAAQPNAGHRALVALAQRGRLGGLVTQNVDGLHERAGSVGVIAMHGRLARVVCLDCSAWFARAEIQERLVQMNPQWREPSGAPIAQPPVGQQRADPQPLALLQALAAGADGDVQPADVALTTLDLARVEVPACSACGGVLKPDVVMYGDGVPAQRVLAIDKLLADCRGMLVVGSSMSAFSGYRICRAARARGLPVAALTLGWTRADALLTLKLDADCVAALASAARLARG